MDIENAILLATTCHRGQKDKAGEPYILHPLWVMSKMESEDERVVAVLHDVFEDCDIAINDVDLSLVQKEALVLLTRPKGMSYKSYIERIATNEIAIKVKMADLEHNMDYKRYASSISKMEKQDKIKFKEKRSVYQSSYNYLSQIKSLLEKQKNNQTPSQG